MMTQVKEVSLEDLLLAREQRAEKQKELIERFNANLVSFTVNIPGKFKDLPISRRIHDEGLRVLKQNLEERNVSILHEELYNKPTGMEAFFSIQISELDLKKLVVEIEDNHPIGRLFDFDVVDKNHKVISRSDIQHLSRKCLICEENAFICVRSQKHSYGELIRTIKKMIKQYFVSV